MTGLVPSITLDGVRRVGAELLDEFGADHVYDPPGPDVARGDAACVYEYGGQPSCFVGRIVNRLGVSVDVLTEWDRHGFGPYDFDETAVTIEPYARVWLAAAQSAQDSFRTWSVSYGEGDEALAEIRADAVDETDRPEGNCE